MDLYLPIHIDKLLNPIAYPQKIMLVGSCFTEHIGGRLQEMKFNVMQNPHGILFDPWSVSNSLVSYCNKKIYRADELIYLNEVWQSWQHHGNFGNTDQRHCLDHINNSQQQAHQFLREADWLIITLGTSFSYRLVETNAPVANCHRAPAKDFIKHLMTIDEINSALDNVIHQMFHFNPRLRIIFTVSPVRHIRDGVVENNRSKARLIEVVHHLANKFDRIFYFPAYEIVIDVLRDYRFFDLDMVHPNYQATEIVLQQFADHFIDAGSRLIMGEIKKIMIARKHRAIYPDTNAHAKFLKTYHEKTIQLKQDHPFLDLREEIVYFATAGAR